MGMTPRYKNVEDMQRNIDLYFFACSFAVNTKLEDRAEELMEVNPTLDESKLIKEFIGQRLTVTGLALALGFTSRQALLNYEQGRGEGMFVDTVKKAKSKVERYIEQRLYENNPAGCIFNLKNNFGWKDKNETEHSTPDGKPFQVETNKLSDDELNARILELTQKTSNE